MRSTARTLPILLVLFATALLLPVRAGADAAIDDTTSHRIDELVALRAGATGASKGELLDLLSDNSWAPPTPRTPSSARQPSPNSW
ncbi:hypothetical protein [Nocardia africana]|uniref:Uncharacterized protein n=1 Tax=Nocardia africana TaxID=134964 RepID=A0A378X1Z3_9NOCA|nr:hypothetical protein [Nocardia africana]SUA46845.1 Uncharacterised protein [Nocardia africana]